MQVYVPISDDWVKDICKSPEGNILYLGLCKSIGISLCSQWIAGWGVPSAEQCRIIECAWVVSYLCSVLSSIMYGGAKI